MPLVQDTSIESFQAMTPAEIAAQESEKEVLYVLFVKAMHEGTEGLTDADLLERYFQVWNPAGLTETEKRLAIGQKHHVVKRLRRDLVRDGRVIEVGRSLNKGTNRNNKTFQAVYPPRTRLQNALYWVSEKRKHLEQAQKALQEANDECWAAIAEAEGT
jgi:hypothetical protein